LAALANLRSASKEIALLRELIRESCQSVRAVRPRRGRQDPAISSPDCVRASGQSMGWWTMPLWLPTVPCRWCRIPKLRNWCTPFAKAYECALASRAVSSP